MCVLSVASWQRCAQDLGTERLYPVGVTPVYPTSVTQSVATSVYLQNVLHLKCDMAAHPECDKEQVECKCDLVFHRM